MSSSFVILSSFLWIVAFYREGCGYCVLLEPELARAATELRRLVRFGAVDVERHRSVADAVSRRSSAAALVGGMKALTL